MKTRGQISILLAVLFVSSVSSGLVELAGEGFIPEPNQEITVQIQTDTPLFCMGLGITVTGDATITGAVSTADCNDYGWDPDWPTDPYIDPEGWVYVSGVSWLGEANGVVGYIKFRYNSGEVSVSITEGDAFDADCEPVSISDETLVFGEPDPNNFGKEGDSSSQDAIIDENTSATAESPNDVNLPLNSYWQNKLAERQQHLMLCPEDSNSSRETFSKSAYRTYQKGNSEQDFAFESPAGNSGGLMLLDEEPNVIEVNSDITTNQIWSANNIYYVTTGVNVRALLVIEPGTMVILGSGYCGLYVNNGGTLISKGMPDKPIIWTCDFMYFEYPEYIGYYWQYLYYYEKPYYFCPIYVEETASPTTTITYNFIEGAVEGVGTENITLNSPIENNYLFGNIYGIFEYGTKLTGIRNNLCFFNDYSGIEVYLADVNGVADANSVITIQNNTCDAYQYDGIYIHGVLDGNNAGWVMLVNNIVSESYWFGLHLCDPCEWVVGIVTNTGYYDDPCNKNWEFEEYNPIEANDCPYIAQTGSIGDFYLIQNCPFIDEGLEYIEETPLIGQTTDIYGSPDCNKIDIGFHYPNWDYSNAGMTSLLADLNNDFTVDYKDLEIFADYWLSPFDFIDFSILANEWGQTTTSSLPAISISVDGDANNLKGKIGISVTGCSGSTVEAFICMDGQLLGTMNYEFGQTPGLTVDSASYLNGSHSFKAVITDSNSIIVISEPYDINFNNPIHCLSMEETYEPNKPLRLVGINAGDSNSIVKLSKWWNDEVVWSQQISGNLDINIPSNVLAGQIYEVSIEQEVGGMLILDSSWEPIWQKAISAKYDPNKLYKFVILLPNAHTYGWCGGLSIRLNSRDCRKYAVAGMINGCKTMNMDFIVLYGDQCTWQNFERVFTGPKSQSILYVYLVSTGGAYPPGSLGTEQRTWFRLSDSYVVSNLDTPVNGAWDYQSDVHPLTSLGLTNYDRFKIVWIDICHNGRFSDMAHAWLGGSGEDLGWPYSLYVSWSQGIQYCIDMCPSLWTSFFWGYPNPDKGFGLYGANTYAQAFDNVQNSQEGGPSCVGSDLVQNSLLGTMGDTSVRFTPDRLDFKPQN